MSIANSFLQELQHEAGNTRKLFDAMSNDVLDYRPDEKAWTMAELAAHISESYHWYVSAFESDALDFATYTYDKGDISSVDFLKAKLEENIAQAAACLEGATDDAVFMQEWHMKHGENTLGSMPRIMVVRSLLMNHLYHHRGQLSAYLRAAGKKVPGIYGPSADER